MNQLEMYDETPKKSELVLNKIMMHTSATEFDRANLLAML